MTLVLIACTVSGLVLGHVVAATLRSEWCEFVDMLARDGHISEDLAGRVTL